MGAAEPPAEIVPTRHAGGLPGDVALEVVRAHPARVQPREELHEAHQVALLRPGRRLRERRRDAMEQGPAAPP